MPSPNKGESREAFLDRCIPMVVEEGREQDQAVAICNSMFESDGKKEKYHFTLKGLTVKEVDGEKIFTGLISTTHPDRVGDIVSKPALEQMVEFINDKNAAGGEHGAFRSVSLFHDWINEQDPTLDEAGFLLPTARLVELDDGHFGVEVDAKVNQFYRGEMPPSEIEYRIENGQIAGFSIEYDTDDEHTRTINHNGEEIRFIEELTGFGGVAFARARLIANPFAVIYKEIESRVKEEEEKKPLNKPFRLPAGSSKKFGVFVRDGDKIKKVTFGDPDMEIRRDDEDARRSFNARHKCDMQKDKTTAAYWSCRMWDPDFEMPKELNTQTMEVDSMQEKEGLLTAIAEGHQHEWNRGDEFTSVVNGHRHRIDESQGVALPEAGHDHGLGLEVSGKELKEDATMAEEEKSPEQPESPVSETPEEPQQPVEESSEAKEGHTDKPKAEEEEEEEPKEEDMKKKKKASEEMPEEKEINKILDSKEFKERINEAVLESKTIKKTKEDDTMSIPLSVKQMKENFSAKNELSYQQAVSQFFKEKDADIREAIGGYGINMRPTQVEVKTVGNKLQIMGSMQTKAVLDTTTNPEGTYNLSIVEFNDIFLPTLIETFNNQTNFFGALPKRDHLMGGQFYGWRIKTDQASSLAIDPDTTAITFDAVEKEKLRTDIKEYRVGVSVTDYVLHHGRAAMGDILMVESQARMSDLMRDMNNDLFTEQTDGGVQVLGLEAVADSAGNTTLYGKTRTTGNRLAPDAAIDTYNPTTGVLTTALLRGAVRNVEVEGALRSNLRIVVNPAVRDIVYELEDSKIEYSNDPNLGFFGTPRFDGVPMIVDSSAQANALFVVDFESEYIVISRAPQMIGLAKTNAAESAYISLYAAHVYEQPRRIYMLDGITG